MSQIYNLGRAFRTEGDTRARKVLDLFKEEQGAHGAKGTAKISAAVVTKPLKFHLPVDTSFSITYLFKMKGIIPFI